MQAQVKIDFQFFDKALMLPQRFLFQDLELLFHRRIRRFLGRLLRKYRLGFYRLEGRGLGGRNGEGCVEKFRGQG